MNTSEIDFVDCNEDLQELLRKVTLSRSTLCNISCHWVGKKRRALKYLSVVLVSLAIPFTF